MEYPAVSSEKPYNYSLSPILALCHELEDHKYIFKAQGTFLSIVELYTIESLAIYLTSGHFRMVYIFNLYPCIHCLWGHIEFWYG